MFSTSLKDRFRAIRKVFLAVTLITGILGVILFTAAGRVDWTEAWWLIGLYAFFLFCFMAWGVLYASDLMKERSRMAGNVKRWDKVINLIFMMTFISVLVVAGLDARYGWSNLQSVTKVIGGTGIVFAGMMVFWTIMTNAYLSRWARLQEDRGQKVISEGPYRIVRHPMYAAIILFLLSIPLELGSGWSFIPAGLASIIYVTRTKKEDAMLHEELEGYVEYAQRVRYRLVRGIW